MKAPALLKLCGLAIVALAPSRGLSVVFHPNSGPPDSKGGPDYSPHAGPPRGFNSPIAEGRRLENWLNDLGSAESDSASVSSFVNYARENKIGLTIIEAKNFVENPEDSTGALTEPLLQWLRQEKVPFSNKDEDRYSDLKSEQGELTTRPSGRLGHLAWTFRKIFGERDHRKPFYVLKYLGAEELFLIRWVLNNGKDSVSSIWVVEPGHPLQVEGKPDVIALTIKEAKRSAFKKGDLIHYDVRTEAHERAYWENEKRN